jgi:hypothetical protein
MKVYQILNEKAKITQGQDKNEMQYLQQVADLLTDELGVSHNNITISLNPPASLDLDKSQNGLTIGMGRKPSEIFIIVDRGLTTAEKVRVLAHEMVHVHQISRGDLALLELVDGKVTGEWQGEPFDFVRYSKSNPWEVEAYTREKELHRFVISKLGNYNQ